MNFAKEYKKVIHKYEYIQWKFADLEKALILSKSMGQIFLFLLQYQYLISTLYNYQLDITNQIFTSGIGTLLA